MVFDKTGTLTEPMQQVALHCANGFAEVRVWRAIAALERDVRHPLGRALAAVAARALSTEQRIAEAVEDTPTLVTKRLLPGLGMVGESADGQLLALGSWALMHQHGASGGEWAGRDATLGSNVFLAIGNEVVARLRVDERLRGEAVDAVAALAARGFRFEHCVRGRWSARGEGC